MSNLPPPQTPLITSPPPPTHYLRPHLTAPHIPPDCPPDSPITPIYCGELSGAISGGVYSYGYLILGNQLVYLNMGGPRMAVEAIRARLSRGEMIHLTPEDAPAVEFTVTGMGKFEDYTENMSNHHFQNTILIHRNITPNYNETDKLTFALILAQSPKQVYTTFYQHLHQLLSIAVFPHWLPTLWATGLSAKIIEKCHGVGGVGYGIYLKASDWESIIALGVATGALPLSETAESGDTITILDVNKLDASTPLATSPTSDHTDTSLSTSLYAPIHAVLSQHLSHKLDAGTLWSHARDLYPIITKHITVGWQHSRDRQREMHSDIFGYLYTRTTQHIRYQELLDVVEALRECAKTLDVAPAPFVYPITMDSDGRRALYRVVGENETLVLLLDEDIQRLKKADWRGNVMKERGMREILARHINDERLLNKVFWVVKTQGEY